MGTTGERKADHLRICLDQDVQSGGEPGWSGYRFDHLALPGIAFDEVDPSTTLLGRPLAWPFLVGAMTGGADRLGRLNQRLALAAEACECGMVLGSLRPALEDPSVVSSYDVRAVAPGLPLLLGNIGAAQLAPFTPSGVEGGGIESRVVALCIRLRLDGIVVHLNPLQESIQSEGDGDWRGLAARIADLQAALAREGLALGVKEVGSGFSAATARWIGALRPALVETAGTGGTSWARVEGLRALPPSHADAGEQVADPALAAAGVVSGRSLDAVRRRVGETFASWGHPAAESLVTLRARAPGVPVVASGGMRTGLDLARAIRLGAAAGAMALPLLRAASEGGIAVEALLHALRLELRIAMFATGSRTLDDLRRAPMRDPSGTRVPFARGRTP
jgi:isopentenyl-diphosphate delta-isomerase